MAGGPYSLGIALISSLAIAALIYLAGRLVAPKGEMSEDRLLPYACGEEMPPVRPKMDMSRFFTYVLLFLAFDITVPIVALAILGHYIQAILYLVVILFAILTPALYLREMTRG